MKATPLTVKPPFPLMKQGDIQNIYHLQMPRWLFDDPRYMGLALVEGTAVFLLQDLSTRLSPALWRSILSRVTEVPNLHLLMKSYARYPLWKCRNRTARNARMASLEVQGWNF